VSKRPHPLTLTENAVPEDRFGSRPQRQKDVKFGKEEEDQGNIYDIGSLTI